jgi:hypothetical protein
MSFSDDDIELSFEDLHRIPQNIFEINPKSLFLTGNILTSLPTEFFCKFSNLNILHLSYNKLKTIPKEFGKLVNLERLYLDHNSIHEFQSGIQTCKYLKKLDLSYNNIQNLPKNPISEENEKLKKILNAKELDEILNNVIIKQFNSFELILEHPLNLDFLKIEVEEEIDLSKIPLNDEFVKLNVNNDENVFNRDDKDSEMSRNRESVQIFDKTNSLITQSRRRRVIPKILAIDVLEQDKTKGLNVFQSKRISVAEFISNPTLKLIEPVEEISQYPQDVSLENKTFKERKEIQSEKSSNFVNTKSVLDLIETNPLIGQNENDLRKKTNERPSILNFQKNSVGEKRRIYEEMLQKRRSANKTNNPSIIKVKKLQKVTESVFKPK